MSTTDVLDSAMYYEDTGEGAAFVFIHGNPMSSYVWRSVIPAVGPGVRVVAPDLIGMGRSGKPDIAYTYVDQARYLAAWFDAVLPEEPVVLVGHDWGGSLAFDWAAHHPDRVRGVTFMETILHPMSLADFPEGARERFVAMRTPGIGEKIVIDQNASLEGALLGSIRSGLSQADHDVYRAPFTDPSSRRPLLQWPRSMPFDGEPTDVVARVVAYDQWLSSTPDVPKLLCTFDESPTMMLTPAELAWCEKNITGLETSPCGAAGHQVLEDQPAAVAAAISGWADRHHLRR